MKMSVFMAGPNITTSIDSLMTYLSEHGKTESSELARALGVSESIIETWADVLEKAKITKITYKVGKMYVSIAPTAAGGLETAKATAEIKKGIAETEIQAQVVAIGQISAKIDEFKRYVTGAEATFKGKAGETKATLEEIDRLDAQVNGAYKKLREKKDYIDGMVESLGKSIQALEQKSGALGGVGAGGDAKVLIEDIRGKLENAEAVIAGLDREFNRTVGESRKGFAELVEGMKKESGALRRQLFQQEKESEEYDSMAKAYGRESERIKRQVAGEREKMLDEISKTSYEVGKVYAVADGQIVALRKSLAEMKSQFGGFAELSDRINKTKGEIGGVEKRRDELAKGLDELSAQLKAASAAGAAGRSLKMGEIEKKVDESEEELEDLDSDLKDVGKDIEGIGR